MDLILEKYRDFGPTLAHEKLTEVDKLKLSRESVRQPHDRRAALEAEAGEAAGGAPDARAPGVCGGAGADRWFGAQPGLKSAGRKCTLLVLYR